MNNIPVLKSKLIMPELPGNFLLTERLKKLYNRMDSCKAVTVCAPAGYGKTTLAVSYFYNHQPMTSRACWYRLDPEDQNLSVFMTHLIELIFPSQSAEFEESRKILNEQSYMQLHPYHIISLICQELWVHSNEASSSTYIVFDDFQNVTHAQDICDIIRFMFDNLPPSCNIFILNRVHNSIFNEKTKVREKFFRNCYR